MPESATVPETSEVLLKVPTPTEETVTLALPDLAPTVVASRERVTTPVVPAAADVKPVPLAETVAVRASLKPSAVAVLAKLRVVVSVLAPGRTLPKSTVAGSVPVVVATRTRLTPVTPAFFTTTWWRTALSMPTRSKAAKLPVVAPAPLMIR